MEMSIHVTSESVRKNVPTSQLKDSTTTLSIFGIEICKTASSYADFCTRMFLAEKTFVESLKL